MVSKLHILDSQEYNEFLSYLQLLSNTDIKWNKVYMSFGSKLNSLTVPSKTFDKTTWISNSLDQMVPSFIRYQSELSHSLVIIIDDNAATALSFSSSIIGGDLRVDLRIIM